MKHVVNDSVRQPVYEFEGFRLDAQRRVLLGADGRSIALTPRLFDALLYFVERAGQLLTKEQLLEAIWPHVVVEEQSLGKTISALRKALGEKPEEHRFIVTKHGRGYRFVANVSVATPYESETVPRHHDGPATGTSWRASPLRLVGAIAAVALLATGVGFGIFDASAPRPDRGLRVRPLMHEKDGGEMPHVIGSTTWKPDGHAIAFSASNGTVPGPPQP